MSDLLYRCCDAYDYALPDSDLGEERGIAAVLRFIAAEILEHHHRASARDVAQLLIRAADCEPLQQQPAHDVPGLDDSLTGATAPHHHMEP